MRGQLDESMIVHVKQHGKISLALREALARAVTEQGTSFAKAYDSVLSSWSVLARTCGHAIEGEIVNKDSKTHAAISSVAMKGRLAQYVLAWEMAAVVSADGRVDRDRGLEWCKADRESARQKLGPFRADESKMRLGDCCKLMLV